MRVPVPDGSVVDLTCRVRARSPPPTSTPPCAPPREGPLARIVEYSEVPLVSSDIIGNPHSSIFDALSTQAARRRLSQGRRLVRQRVGLLEPRRGPRRTAGARSEAETALRRGARLRGPAVAASPAPPDFPRGTGRRDGSSAANTPAPELRPLPARRRYTPRARGRSSTCSTRAAAPSFRSSASAPRPSEFGWILASSYNSRERHQGRPEHARR